jgi:hypothetical protein
LQAQYRLTKFQEGGWIPTISVVALESLPTGKYDQLGGRPADGFGGGAWSTTLGLYSQTYFWTPGGRILRTRLNLTYTGSPPARVRDVSVYGTPDGFRGHARPGDAFNADLAFEYSASRDWVLALDLGYERDAATHVTGTVSQPSAAGPTVIAFRRSSGASESLIVAPAIEYNWSPTLGVIIGAEVLPAGRNAPAMVRPAIAINYVH